MKTKCLSGGKLNMLADIQKPAGSPEVTGTGHWEWTQNPESGAIEQVWVTDDPNVAETKPGLLEDVPCSVMIVRGATLRNTERFGTQYDYVERIEMSVAPNVSITVDDKVTNVRDSAGTVIYRETTVDNSPPTTFNVIGLTPLTNPFGRITDVVAVLERAGVQ